MPAVSVTPLTESLAQWTHRGSASADCAVSDAYAELTRIARSLVRRERHRTLDTGGLVHEAYLRLIELEQPGWRSRAHFFNVAAGVMRRVLVDRARARRCVKRGGDAVLVTFADDCSPAVDTGPALDIIALDAALETLALRDPDLSQIVQLRFFAGLTVEQTARTVGISPATLKRKWVLARAWLHRELGPAGGAAVND